VEKEINRIMYPKVQILIKTVRSFESKRAHAVVIIFSARGTAVNKMAKRVL
jgi:cobalamin biosynthesis Co2+ chelatase CbiK